jgi:hypothetical protein
MSDVMTIDLSNYKDRVGARVTPGRYRVVVEDVEQDKSKTGGNPMINVWYKIIGGEFDGQTLIDRLTITEKALFRVVGFMQAIGLPTPKKKLQINPRRFLGQKLDVDVDDGEPYNGRVKSEIRGYVRIPKDQRDNEAQDLETESAEAPDATSNPDPALAAGAATAAAATGETPGPAGGSANTNASASASAASDDDGEVDLDNLDL